MALLQRRISNVFFIDTNLISNLVADPWLSPQARLSETPSQYLGGRETQPSQLCYDLPGASAQRTELKALRIAWDIMIDPNATPHPRVESRALDAPNCISTQLKVAERAVELQSALCRD
jgi:hypothetical protein